MITLYCLAPAGGSKQVFRPWRKKLHEGIVLCPLELPGHGARMREGLLGSIEELAEDLFGQVRSGLERHGGMYALFAHSMGCWISLELIKRIRAASLPEPEHLFLSAMPAPHPTFPPGAFMQRLAERTLSDQEFMAELINANILPGIIAENAFLQTIHLPIFRADFSALHRYCPERENGCIRCSCSILYGQNDTVVPADMLEDWKEWIEGEVSVRGFNGRHMFITSEAHDVTTFINKMLIREEVQEKKARGINQTK